MMSLIMPIVA